LQTGLLLKVFEFELAALVNIQVTLTCSFRSKNLLETWDLICWQYF